MYLSQWLSPRPLHTSTPRQGLEYSATLRLLSAFPPCIGQVVTPLGRQKWGNTELQQRWHHGNSPNFGDRGVELKCCLFFLARWRGLNCCISSSLHLPKHVVTIQYREYYRHSTWCATSYFNLPLWKDDGYTITTIYPIPGYWRSA